MTGLSGSCIDMTSDGIDGHPYPFLPIDVKAGRVFSQNTNLFADKFHHRFWCFRSLSKENRPPARNLQELGCYPAAETES